MSGLRFALVPLLLWLAWADQPRLFLACFLLSLATDAVDGFVARYLRQATPLGARLDSWADFLTSLALPFCVWWLRPDVIRSEALLIGVGLFTYLLAIAIGFLKFGKLTSYHTWSAKLCAVLFAAVMVVIFADGPAWALRIVIPIVVLSAVEEIIITLILPQPVTDVPSLWHALKRRPAPEKVRGP